MLLHSFSSDFNFQIFKYFLVELWIPWSKFKPIGNICLVTEYFIIRGTANLRFSYRSEEEREVSQVLTDLNCPALLCCGWLYVPHAASPHHIYYFAQTKIDYFSL